MKVLTIVFLLTLQVFAQQIYTMQDLKILAAQNEYTEYLNHAKDITPSKRNKNWRTRTLKVGIGFTNYLSKKNSSIINSKDKKLLKEISKWPLFKKDEAFKISKRPLIVKSLNQCLESKEVVNKCIESTLKLYLLDSDPELGLKIIKSLNSKRPMEFDINAVIPFVRPMLSANICIYFVKKSPMREVLKSLTNSSNSFFLESKVDKDCRKDLSKDIFTNLYSTNNNHIRKSSKILLQRWGLIHSNDIYFYNLAQFLSGYQFPKELILTKWKTFRTLGKNEKLRTLILKKLLNRKPLFGSILYQTTNESNAIISAIRRHIPEYFVEYAKQCINYYNGLTKAPSADCHQIFKRTKDLKLFSETKLHEYEKIMSSWKQ